MFLAERPAGHGERVEVQQRLHLAQDGDQPAGAMQVFHVVLARGLQVDQHRRFARNAVEAVQVDADAERGPAMAVRWIMPLVEPPMASSTRSAFSKAFGVRIWSGRQVRADHRHGRAPVRSAMRMRSAVYRGRRAPPGSIMPSASRCRPSCLPCP